MMASGGQVGGPWRQLGRIFDEGTASGLSDPELLGRFATARDGPAFAAIVGRHGPMVLATCRGVLRSADDAEDAFQATFLVLARKAGSIRVDGSLGGWLHRVARRVAVRANVEGARRRAREKAGTPVEATEPGPRPFADLIPLLHEEIGRLPARYREPIVLCDLGELTRDEAAGQLGWPPGTVAGRLSRARKLLRDRMARRGVSPTALAPLAGLPRAAVPPAWAEAAARAACPPSTSAAAGTVSATALLWGERVIRAMFLAKLRFVGALALAAATASAGLLAVGTLRGAEGQTPASKAPAMPPIGAEPPVIPRPGEGETVEVRGRVLDPDGRPVAGAVIRIDVFLGLNEPDPREPRATSGPDGRFALRAAREVFDRFASGRSRRPARVVATASGFGYGWAEPGRRSDALADVTVTLARDDVPIEGRVLDLEGRPVAGATFRPINSSVPAGGDLSPWIVAFRDRDQGPWDGLDQMPLNLAPVVTGADGRFRLAGVGRERLAQFVVSGPGIETDFAYAMTRVVPTIRTKNRHMIGHDFLFYHGARFDYAAAPSRPIVGVVRDRDTGRPLPGVRVNGMPYDERSRAFNSYIAATTDAEGRYRLGGLTKADRYRIFLAPGNGQPYPPAAFVEAAGTPGLDPATIDLRLKRGVLVRGQLVDKATGRPLAGSVEAYTYLDNPHARDFPGHSNTYAARVFAGPEGRFEVAALPGRGFLAARLDTDTRYRWGVGAGSIRGMNPRMPFSAIPSFMNSPEYHVLAEYEAPPGADSATLDLRADPGRDLAGTIVDPEGRPVSGCTVRGLSDVGFYSATDRPHESATFEATGLDPSKPRRIAAFHRDRALAGSLLVRGDEPGQLVLRLQPWGTIAGRVVDDEGNPRPKIRLTDIGDPEFDPDKAVLYEDFAAYESGRFRVHVVPGLSNRAFAIEGNGRLLGKVFESVKVVPGEVKELGDIRLRPDRDN